MIQTIKLFYINFVYQLLRLYWFVRRPAGRGVKVLLECEDKVLLVTHNYGHRLWTVPGGGVKSDELSELAAVREIYEELGVLLDRVTYLGQYESNNEYKHVTVDCFKASVTRETKVTIDNFEIAKYAWFTLDSLPAEKASSVTKIISLYEIER